MVEVSKIDHLSELETIRSEWEDLLGRSRNATIFQTPEWLLNYQKYFGKGRIKSFAVRNQGKLIALAPCEQVSTYGIPFKRLQFIGTGSTDYLDFILDQQEEQTALNAIYSHLINEKNQWEIVDLQQVPQESPTRHFWSSNGSQDQFHLEQLEQEECPTLPLPETWEQFLAGLGKKTRWNIGYYERIARRDFEFDMGVLAPDEVPEGMSALFRLHTLRWRQRWLPGVLAGAHRQNFHQEVARGFSLKNWLRLYAIRLDHEIQAVLYCFSYQGKGYYYLGGFEPALSKYSLGTVLTAYAIHDSIEAGLNEFDFLRGNEPYKARWTRNHRMNYRLLLRKSTLRSDLATGMVHGERRIEHAFKEALHQRFGRG